MQVSRWKKEVRNKNFAKHILMKLFIDEVSTFSTSQPFTFSWWVVNNNIIYYMHSLIFRYQYVLKKLPETLGCVVIYSAQYKIARSDFGIFASRPPWIISVEYKSRISVFPNEDFNSWITNHASKPFPVLCFVNLNILRTQMESSFMSSSRRALQ